RAGARVVDDARHGASQRGRGRGRAGPRLRSDPLAADRRDRRGDQRGPKHRRPLSRPLAGRRVHSPGEMIRAVLFDIGGVLTESPFQAFARYESMRGLPKDFLRTLNATNPDTNAWARLERSEVSVAEFAPLYEAEALAAGHEISGVDVLGLLSGAMVPSML